jgi:hypothetical protein
MREKSRNLWRVIRTEVEDELALTGGAFMSVREERKRDTRSGFPSWAAGRFPSWADSFPLALLYIFIFFPLFLFYFLFLS